MSDFELDWLHKRPLKPCRKCGLPVTAKWIAGYGEKLRKIAPHPFGGRAGWYVSCECGAWFWPIGNACDGEKQLRVLRKLEREWNRMQEETNVADKNCANCAHWGEGMAFSAYGMDYCCREDSGHYNDLMNSDSYCKAWEEKEDETVHER